MMTRFQRTDVNPDLLMDALVQHYPHWRGTFRDGMWHEPLVFVMATREEIMVEHPDADIAPVIASVRGKVREKTRAQRLADAGLNETDEAIRLVNILGERAPAWAHEVVASYLQRVNEAMS